LELNGKSFIGALGIDLHRWDWLGIKSVVPSDICNVGVNIAALAQLACKKYNISLVELRSGSRRREVAIARGSISWIAVRELGYSGADVARYLGVTNSCVTRFVASGQKPDVDDLITKL
jgi:hypothetical protein